MKKNLGKILYFSLVFSLLVHMFMPLTVSAATYGSKQITFAWNCGGGICANGYNVQTYYEEGGIRDYANNMVSSDIFVDGGHTFVAATASSYGKVDYHNQYYIFEGTTIDAIKAKSTWEALDEAIHEDDPSVPHPIDPCGGVDGINSVSHNGDREFRLTVFDSGYEPIIFNVDPSTYTYYLGEWDPVFTNPSYDISGTTEESPLDYNTYLLENTLEFRMDGIASVEALDVPKKGINIRVTDNEVVNIKFNSNYYSNVTFKITMSNNKVYYLRVNRIYTQLEVNTRMNPEGRYDQIEAYASFIYPANKSYADYDVYATITTASGTETKKLTAKKVEVLTRSDGVVEDTEFPAGENLLKAYYPLGIDKNVKDVKITVTNKGATTGSVYGGTFGGYGEGVSLDDVDLFVKMLTNPRV